MIRLLDHFESLWTLLYHLESLCKLLDHLEKLSNIIIRGASSDKIAFILRIQVRLSAII